MEIKVETRFGDLELLVAIDPFDQALAALQREKATLATAQQVAQARIVAGPDTKVSQYDSWVAENFVYFPNGKIFITPAKHSPILKHSAEATAAHRSGKEFYISKEEAAGLEKLARSGEVYTLKQTEDYEIPIEKFAKNGLARFVFGDATIDYAKFLEEAGVNEVPVWFVDPKYVKEQKAPFARVLWLCDLLGNRSVLYGRYRDLDVDYRARGVRKVKSADAANAYESIAQNYGLKSPDNLRDVLEKYTKVREALQ